MSKFCGKFKINRRTGGGWIVEIKQIKDKLLKYSVPKEDDEGKFVDIRFYQNEVLDMFKILFDGIKDEVGYETDYYQILLEARNQLNKSNEE